MIEKVPSRTAPTPRPLVASSEANIASAGRRLPADAGRRPANAALSPSGVGLLRLLALCGDSPALAAFVERAAALDDRRLALVERFTEQVIEVHDPDAVETFLAWKADPVIDSVLLLVAGLDEDARYEVLDLAEDLRRAAP